MQKYLNLPDIDGLLIGRASLEPAAFLKWLMLPQKDSGVG
ncbi:Uncharacterised protein [Weissella viridescens]|uniref:Triose-phosphate isomerase n=1 Tax=Weissella viridescens TaxID=1629 RepID=A0A380P197_WEIVI|nr:Uncharacterised protein [Weissella viridescens]